MIHHKYLLTTYFSFVLGTLCEADSVSPTDLKRGFLPCGFHTDQFQLQRYRKPVDPVETQQSWRGADVCLCLRRHKTQS